MKKFKEFNEDLNIDILSEVSDTNDDSKKSIIAFITSSFQRFLNTNNDNNKGLIYLVAALSVINSNDDSPQTQSTARRLAQMAFRKANK